MKPFKLTYKPYGKHAILIEWPPKIDKNVLKNVLLFKNKIIENDIKAIVDVISTYNSLTIIYVSTIENIYNEILTLKAIYKRKNAPQNVKNYCWKIPVCYDLKFGLDLKEISKNKKLDIDQIIKLHSDIIYTVYFIGFLPGFLYLGGLDPNLSFPRKSTPRLTVEEGSVGIGGSQTGIYPSKNPGGWNIIGKTPVSLFDIKEERPCFAKAGDAIRFIPIDIDGYQQIKTQVEIGFYKIEKELLND